MALIDNQWYNIDSPSVLSWLFLVIETIKIYFWCFWVPYCLALDIGFWLPNNHISMPQAVYGFN